MKAYEGPREFNTSDPAQLKRELGQFAAEFIRLHRAFLDGGAPRLEPLELVNAPSGQSIDAAAGFGHYLPIDSSGGGTVRVRFPKPNSKDGGRVLAVERRSTSGTIVLMPSGGALLNGSATVSMAATRGLYLYLFDGVGWSGNNA